MRSGDETPMRVIGIENEFVLHRHGYPTSAKRYMGDFVKLIGRPTFSKANHSYRLWTGGAFYVDGREPEVCTPPIELRPGCATECVDSIVLHRNMVVEMVDRYNTYLENGLSLEGYSTHYNFQVDDAEIDRLKQRMIGFAAIPCLLLLENRFSSGVMFRNKPSRLEICGDYVSTREQMIASVVFMLGAIYSTTATQSILACRPRVLNQNQVGRRSFDVDFIAGGRDAELEVVRHKRRLKITAQELLEEAFVALRGDIERLAEPDEISLLEQFITGERTLDIDLVRRPQAQTRVEQTEMSRVEIPRLAAAFGKATGPQSYGEHLLTTSNITWDYVDYRIDDTLMRLKREDLLEFQESLGGNHAFRPRTVEIPRYRVRNLSDGGMPQGIAVLDDRVYFADSLKHCVSVVSSEGEPISVFGKKGRQSGALNSPRGILIFDDRVYVTDRHNHRVQVFSLSGVPRYTWGGFGTNAGQLRYPEGIAAFGDRIYVSDHWNHRVQVFDPHGRFLSAFGGLGKAPGGLNSPKGIAVTEDRIFVVDSANHRVQIFDFQGELISFFGEEGFGYGQFRFPEGIAINENHIFVTDTFNGRMQVFDREAKFLHAVHDATCPELRLDRPLGLALADGGIYISDVGGGGVFSLSPRGSETTTSVDIFEPLRG